MTATLIILACMVSYAIKGGWHGVARRFLERAVGIEHDDQGQVIGSLSVGQWLLHRALDGKPLSAVIFGGCCAAVGAGFLLPAAAWLVGVSPSIKDPVSGVGGVRGNWREGSAIGYWKDGAIRGVFMGAMLALAFSHTAPIIGCALFPLVYFIGISIEQLRTGEVKASWHWAEPIMGLVIGICVSTAMKGVL